MKIQGAAISAPLALALLATGCVESPAEGTTEKRIESSNVTARQRVKVHTVRRAPLDSENRVTGIVRAFYKASVTAEAPGRVIARRVERGAQVAAGEALVQLDESRLALELRRAEATLLARIHDLEHAEREHDRGERMEARSAISEQNRDDLRHALDSARDQRALALVARDTAKRSLEDATVTAPFSGTVDDLYVDVGDYVAPGTPVATVVEQSRARVFAGVTAQQAVQLDLARGARVRFTDLGGHEVVAELKSVSSVANERDGTYTIELWIDQPPLGLRDGMVATVNLPPADRDAQLLAPRAALMRRGGQSEVFVVVREDGVFFARIRSLRTGRSAGDWIEVADGLRDGDEVIVDGQFALRDGVAVTVDSSHTRSD